MAKQGIITGAVKNTLQLAGAIPVGILRDFTPKGGAVDRYVENNIDRVREVVGAGVLAAVGIAIID